MSEFTFLGEGVKRDFLKLLEPISRLLQRLGVHPHILTFLGLLFSLLAANFFGIGRFFWGGLFVGLAGICDLLDGKLARGTNQASKFGALLDSIVDRYAEGFIFLGLALYWRSSWLLWVIILGLLGSLLVSYVRARSEGFGVECKIGIFKREERMTLLCVGAMLGAIPYTAHIFLRLALLFIAIFANVTVIQRILYFRKAVMGGEEKVEVE